MQLFSQTSNNMGQLADQIKKHENQINDLTRHLDTCNQCRTQLLIQLQDLHNSQRFPGRKQQINECHRHIKQIESCRLDCERLIEKNEHDIEKLQQKKDTLEQVIQIHCQNNVTANV